MIGLWCDIISFRFCAELCIVLLLFCLEWSQLCWWNGFLLLDIVLFTISAHVENRLSVCLCLSVLSVHLSVRTCLSLCPSVCMSISQSVIQPASQSVSQSVGQSLSVGLSLCLPVCFLSVTQSVSLPANQSGCPYDCLFVCMYVLMYLFMVLLSNDNLVIVLGRTISLMGRKMVYCVHL